MLTLIHAPGFGKGFAALFCQNIGVPAWLTWVSSLFVQEAQAETTYSNSGSGLSGPYEKTY